MNESPFVWRAGELESVMILQAAVIDARKENESVKILQEAAMDARKREREQKDFESLMSKLNDSKRVKRGVKRVSWAGEESEGVKELRKKLGLERIECWADHVEEEDRVKSERVKPVSWANAVKNQ